MKARVAAGVMTAREAPAATRIRSSSRSPERIPAVAFTTRTCRTSPSQ